VTNDLRSRTTTPHLGALAKSLAGSEPTTHNTNKKKSLTAMWPRCLSGSGCAARMTPWTSNSKGKRTLSKPKGLNLKVFFLSTD